MKNNKYLIISVIVSTFGLMACGTFFGNRTNLDFIVQPDFNIKQVAYVPIQPVITGFDMLSDVTTGFDQMIYVTDKGTQEVIVYDESFVELGRKKITGATRTMQNRRLDLYVIGYTDTTISTKSYRLTTIFKLDLNKTGPYGLSNAKITKKIMYPFDFGRNSLKPTDTLVRFTDITPLSNGSYYVSRTGTTATDLLTGPDDAILFFTPFDKYVNLVQVLTSNGTEDKYFKNPVAMTSFIQPPQSDRISTDFGFVYVSGLPSEQQKAKVISGTVSDFGAVFSVEDLNAASSDREKSDGGLYEFNQFVQPSDVAFAGDGTQLIYVTDAAKDSVYVFTRTGLEGVNPPVGSLSKKNVKVSFGGSGIGLYQFNKPVSITYNKKIIIIADQGNKRIMRYKLTTDFE